MKLLKIYILLFTSFTLFSQSNIDSIIFKNKVYEVKIFDSTDVLVAVFRYDVKSNLLFKLMDNFTSAIFLKISETNTYNENGKLVKSISTHSSFNKPTIWKREYDKSQNLLNIKDEKGKLIFQYFYDNFNFKNKEMMYSGNKISQTTLFESLNNGNEIISLIKRVTFTDSNTEYEAGEAFLALEKMYKQIPINRASAPAITKYYVPYLNLYPKTISDTTAAQAGLPQPPFEAELRILVDVEGTDEPDQIRVVFDKRYFEIDGKDGTDANPVLISDKTIGAQREASGTIKIKCIAEFPLDQDIKVYAYPKNSLTQTTAQQLILRKLAGKIIVPANLNKPKIGNVRAITNRKKLKVVLVQVRTNVGGTEATGSFTPDEKINLQNALHQGLIHGEVDDFVARDAHGNPQLDTLGANIDYLDLSTNSDFKVGGKFISSGLILRTEPTLNSTLRTLVSINTSIDYSKYFYVFVFGIQETTTNVGGRVEEIGKKSVVLYPRRDAFTLNHETLHGLGLYHTHADGTISDSDQKFVFTHARTDPTRATDNIMSYQPDGKTTWKWQWNILKKHI